MRSVTASLTIPTPSSAFIRPSVLFGVITCLLRSAAISSGNRCGLGCDESTIVPGLIYLPAGKYLVRKPIVLFWYTEVVGDAINPPTIVAAPDFSGNAILDADPDLGA